MLLDIPVTCRPPLVGRRLPLRSTALILYLPSIFKHLHIMEKILDLDRPLVISELCVQLSCMPTKDMVEQILKKYKERNEIGKDFSHP